MGGKENLVKRFVVTEFVKTCDELVIDPDKMQKSADIEYKRLCAIYGVGNQKHCRFCDFINSKTSAVKRHLKCHLLSTGYTKVKKNFKEFEEYQRMTHRDSGIPLKTSRRIRDKSKSSTLPQTQKVKTPIAKKVNNETENSVDFEENVEINIESQNEISESVFDDGASPKYLIQGFSADDCPFCEYKSKKKDVVRKHIDLHFLGSLKVEKNLNEFQESLGRHLEESIKASTPRRALKGVKFCSFCDYKCKINSHMKRHLCSHLFGTVQVQKNLEEWKEFEKSTPLNNEGTGWDVTNEILLRATERVGDTNSKKQNIQNTPWASSKNKTIYSKKSKKDVIKMKVVHFCPFCKSVSRDITDLERHITRHFITGKVLKRRITKNPSLYQEVKNKIGITEHVQGTAQPNYHLVTDLRKSGFIEVTSRKMRITKDQIAMYNRTETLKSLDELEMENENPENVLKCQINTPSDITAMKTEAFSHNKLNVVAIKAEVFTPKATPKATPLRKKVGRPKAMEPKQMQTCPFCDHTCIPKSNMNAHIYRHYEGKIQVKDWTSKNFKRLVKMKQISGESRLVCPFCDFDCKFRMNMRKHMKRHLINKDYTVNKNLDEFEKFKNDKTSIDYVASETSKQCNSPSNDYKYFCNFCDYTCWKSENMDWHLTSHFLSQPLTPKPDKTITKNASLFKRLRDQFVNIPKEEAKLKIVAMRYNRMIRIHRERVTESSKKVRKKPDFDLDLENLEKITDTKLKTPNNTPLPGRTFKDCPFCDYSSDKTSHMKRHLYSHILGTGPKYGKNKVTKNADKLEEFRKLNHIEVANTAESPKNTDEQGVKNEKRKSTPMPKSRKPGGSLRVKISPKKKTDSESLQDAIR